MLNKKKSRRTQNSVYLVKLGMKTADLLASLLSIVNLTRSVFHKRIPVHNEKHIECCRFHSPNRFSPCIQLNLRTEQLVCQGEGNHGSKMCETNLSQKIKKNQIIIITYIRFCIRNAEKGKIEWMKWKWQRYGKCSLESFFPKSFVRRFVWAFEFEKLLHTRHP